jgi:hypothetical protein
MNYPTKEPIKLGDRVRLGDDTQGVVVCVIDLAQYSEAYPSKDWAYLKKGVLISFPKAGLIHYETSVDPDLELIARNINS